MQASKVLLASLVLLAAGCLGEQQSTSAVGERRIEVAVPSGATQLRVEATATDQAGQPDVTLLVKDDMGTILASRTFAVEGTTMQSVTVDARGQQRVVVVAEAMDGEAALDLRVVALVPGGAETVVVHETVVIVSHPTSTTPTPGTSPTPATSSPTPPPANSTNATSSPGNATG